MRKAKAHNLQISKLNIYLGYSDEGKIYLHKIHQFCKTKKMPISTLVLDALRKAYPEIGL